MRLYFLGIGGTLMGSLALLAQQKGFAVSGFDRALYPPMSDQLAAAGIEVFEGFDPAQLRTPPDLAIVGNAGMPRGHEAVEYVLEHDLPYTSGAEWLGEAVLRERWTIAAAGTHGKTTTASMIAHILDDAGLDPGFLIGGVPVDFPASARLGTGRCFVVEADEYDTSYFDRRSKFLHYRPRTLVINNLEFDHADIFDDLDEIQYQFHHLVRAVPRSGLIIAPGDDANVEATLERGCWTPVSTFGLVESGETPVNSRMATADQWHAVDIDADGSRFTVSLNGTQVGSVDWKLIGRHNVANALAALAAAQHAGVPAADGIAALATFRGVRRRMELIVDRPGLKVYDDFAHHPTAIRTTLEGLRARVGSERIVAVIEPRTHTMSLGTLRRELTTCSAAADEAIWFRGDNIQWDVAEEVQDSLVPASVESDIDGLVDRVAGYETDHSFPTHVVVMSNGAFGGIYDRLRTRLGGVPGPGATG